MTTQRGSMNTALKIVAVLLAALFLVAGGAKIGGWLDVQFGEWGYSPGLAVLIGIFEIVFAIALLSDRTATWAAFGLMIIMLGATGTHLLHGQYSLSLVPIAVFALLGLVAWARGPERSSGRSEPVVGAEQRARPGVPSRA